MLKVLGKISMALSAVRLIDEHMPAQTLSVFIAIAQNNGITVSEIGVKTNLTSSSASRNVQALSDWHWLKRPGLGLVSTEVDLMDTRRKIVKLKPKGEQLAKQLACILGG